MFLRTIKELESFIEERQDWEGFSTSSVIIYDYTIRCLVVRTTLCGNGASMVFDTTSKTSKIVSNSYDPGNEEAIGYYKAIGESLFWSKFLLSKGSPVDVYETIGTPGPVKNHGVIIHDPNTGEVITYSSKSSGFLNHAVSMGHPMVAVSPSGEVSRYFGARECERVLGIPNGTIRRCCIAPSGSHTIGKGKYKGWSFYEEKDYYNIFI